MALLTTHVGSLPRSQEVVDFLFARERGEPYDPATFAATMTRAVAEVVRRQVEAGIDIVSDGETSKISYATYVKDRYSGFAGDSPRNAPADLKLFPSFLKSASRTPAALRNTPARCASARSAPPASTSSNRTSPTSAPPWPPTAPPAAS
jgi:5-methyltetrahydropteroyltriglutamate--homocysteine methyltransferase